MALSRLSLHKHIRRLKDPRINRRKRHLLGDILTIAVCAVIAGANTWPDIETFGHKRQDWLQRFLDIAQRHTLARHLRACLRSSPAPSPANRPAGLVARDQRRLGRAAHRHRWQNPASFRRWFVAVAALALGQRLGGRGQPDLGPSGHRGEIQRDQAIPRLLELLDVQGALVSIDAMGCQKAIAAKIVAGGGDYVLTVKDNQEHLRADIEACFIKAYDHDCQGIRYETYETVEKGHGRQEKRIYELIHGAGGYSRPRGLGEVVGDWQVLQRADGGGKDHAARCVILSAAGVAE